MITTPLRTFKTKYYTVVIDVVDFCEGCSWLEELYTPTDQHQAGTTIQVPTYLQTHGAYKYYIGQYTPAELASDYAKRGIENPSAEAYKNLQQELEHYILASDCALRCSVFKAGIKLSEAYGTTFEHSNVYDKSYEEAGAWILKDYGFDFAREAIEEARTTLTALAA